MANTPSAKKAARKIERRTAVNKSRRTYMRGQLRKMEEAIAAGDQDAAREQLRLVQPVVMKAASRPPRKKFTATGTTSALQQ